MLWLDHGYLEGDDTDAHIDTLARFAARDAIVFQACDDPDRFALRRTAGDGRRDRRAAHRAMASRTGCSRCRGRSPIIDERPPARGQLRQFPDRQWRGADAGLRRCRRRRRRGRAGTRRSRTARSCQVPCRPLIWQNGSLHCITMQLPARHWSDSVPPRPSRHTLPTSRLDRRNAPSPDQERTAMPKPTWP